MEQDKLTFNKDTNTIYVDLDGVLVGFTEYIFKHTGKPYLPDEETWKFVKSVNNFYFKLEPTSYCYELWDAINAIGANVEILTGLPRRTVIETAQQDKIDWVAKYLGGNVKVNFGPYSRDKHNWARPFDVLIDDLPPNIDAWNAAGGIGYLHRERKPNNTFKFLAFL